MKLIWDPERRVAVRRQVCAVAFCEHNDATVVGSQQRMRSRDEARVSGGIKSVGQLSGSHEQLTGSGSGLDVPLSTAKIRASLRPRITTETAGQGAQSRLVLRGGHSPHDGGGWTASGSDAAADNLCELCFLEKDDGNAKNIDHPFWCLGKHCVGPASCRSRSGFSLPRHLWTLRTSLPVTAF